MSEIKPALTPEEWQEYKKGPSGQIYVAPDEDSHGAAAVLLYGQPFGFEHWMVDWITDRSWGNVPAQIEADVRFEEDVDSLVANRIAALLPPREEQAG